jgi:hypothetical protein
VVIFAVHVCWADDVTRHFAVHGVTIFAVHVCAGLMMLLVTLLYVVLKHSQSMEIGV